MSLRWTIALERELNPNYMSDIHAPLARALKMESVNANRGSGCRWRTKAFGAAIPRSRPSAARAASCSLKSRISLRRVFSLNNRDLEAENIRTDRSVY